MYFELITDLHKDGVRQGPGGQRQTQLAITLSGLAEKNHKLRIADVGCGTGASTMVLAESLNADITAVDLSPVFLELLEKRAQAKGLSGKIKTLRSSMDDLPFKQNSLDAIWSEGAIYNIGFEKGISYLKQFLKPGGILAVSELIWFTIHRPDEITSYWNREYPAITTSSSNIKRLEDQGFAIEGYFPLPESCWRDEYYNPLRERFEAFLSRHDTVEGRAMIKSESEEIELYNQYAQYYGYGFFIARKHSRE